MSDKNYEKMAANVEKHLKESWEDGYAQGRQSLEAELEAMKFTLGKKMAELKSKGAEIARMKDELQTTIDKIVEYCEIHEYYPPVFLYLKDRKINKTGHY